MKASVKFRPNLLQQDRVEIISSYLLQQPFYAWHSYEYYQIWSHYYGYGLGQVGSDWLPSNYLFDFYFSIYL